MSYKMHYRYITLLVLFLNASHGTDTKNLIENLQTLLDSHQDKDNDIPVLKGLKNYLQNDKEDESNEKEIPDNEPIFKNRKFLWKMTTTEGKDLKTLSPATPSPSLKNRRLWRKKKRKSSSSSSSEIEEKQQFLDDWGEKRLRLKFQALNSTEPLGDVVNMKSARPWGVACGDPNQHDLPWGTCTLTAECDAEYRIYRGDSFCGRTMFVCCGLIHTSYDMYQGLDLSFDHDDSLTTDTEEQERLNSHEVRNEARKKRRQLHKRRKRAKEQLKKKIRSSIRNVVIEITKLLQKAYRNGTSQQYLKTREMVKFVKKMKEQYKKDRKSVVDAHELDMMTKGFEFQEHLDKMYGVNEKFISNDTFRDIVVNGTVNREKLTQLQRTHPVLSLFFKNRRMGGGDIEPEPNKIERRIKKDKEVTQKKRKNRKVLEYDLEYGILYY